MSKKIVTLGEIMLRLSPAGYNRFIQANTFDINFGGGESNVAISLANFGEDAYFVSKLPTNEIGQAALNELRKYGVKTDYISRGGNRLGIYFLEKGASQRPSKVIYDRAYSSFAESNSSEYDWDSIFENAEWFHFTGITPALSENAKKICLQACTKAKERGITISCDLNYRKKLWTKEQAKETMSGLCKYVDVCIANEADADDVFGIHSNNTNIESGILNRNGYENVARELADTFNFSFVAITLRTSFSANDNRWNALLYDGTDYYYGKDYDVHIVDRVGGGDSFCGGLIYSLVNGHSTQNAIDFAVSASCLKHSIEGDFNHVTVDEVSVLQSGDGSGRVQR